MNANPVERNEGDYDFSDLVNEREWRRCFPQTKNTDELLAGFLYFCENYWHIRHPERGRILFEPFDAQIETVESWLNDRYSLVLKARQIGFSTLIATFAYWLAFGYQDRPILMLSRTEREAIKLLSKSKYGRQFLPEWMKFRGGPFNATQTKMEFANNSYLESLPSASDPARGESAYLIVVDEMAFLPNSEEAWGAIEPVADVGGRVIMLSTANGEGNLFHRLWVEARTGNNRFKPLFFPWSANGRDNIWYEAKASDTPPWLMAQEYPSDEEEAFLKSGRPVLDLDVLRKKREIAPKFEGFISEKLDWISGGGPFSIWEWPDPDIRYVIGADPSQGLEHSDFASIHVLNAKTGDVSATWHGRIDPDLLGSDVLYRLGKLFNSALIGVESNQHGLSTIKALQRLNYFPLYYERSPKYKRSVPTDVMGFRTTQTTKPLIIDELQLALRDGMEVRCAHTLAELRTFVRNEKGKMMGSPYDDRTMSLAIANYMLRFVGMVEFQPSKHIEPGSWQDWEKRTFGQTFDELIARGPSRRGSKQKSIGQFAIRTKSRI